MSGVQREWRGLDEESVAASKIPRATERMLLSVGGRKLCVMSVLVRRDEAGLSAPKWSSEAG